MGKNSSKPLKYLQYEVLPTPGGNVVVRRNNSYVDRIFFDKTGTIWNIKSDAEFDALRSKPFDNKEFTFGEIYFTSNADYDSSFDICTKALFRAKYYHSNDLTWDNNWDAYKCNCTYDEDGLHPPPQGLPLIEKYTVSKYFDGGCQILVDGKLYQTTGYDGIVYLNGKFYNHSRYHEEIKLAECPDAGDLLNLPNYTSVLIIDPPIVVEDFIIITTPFCKSVLFMGAIQFDYNKCAFIKTPCTLSEIYLIEIKTGNKLCRMRMESPCSTIFQYYGFKEAEPPEHPYYLSFGEYSPFEGPSAKKIKLMVRNNIYYAVGEKEIYRGEVYSRTPGSRTKAALRE